MNKERLTSKERVMATIEGRIPDRVPWLDQVDNHLAFRILDHKPEERWQHVRNLPEVISFLGIDGFSLRVAPPELCEIEEKKGLMMRGKGKIRTRDDLERIGIPEPDVSGIRREAEEVISEYGDRYVVIFSTRCGLMNTVLSMGYEAFSYALYSDPDLVDDLHNRMRDWTLSLIEELSDLPFDILRVTDDIAYKRGLLFSPKLLRQYLIPALKTLTAAVDWPLMYHSDGDYSAVLDDLIELGTEVLSNIEPGAMDIVRLKREYGDRVTLMGNIDLDHTLTRGSPEEAYRETRDRIKQLAPGGRYILSSSNSLPRYCRPENVIAMKDALEDHGWY